MGWFSQPDFCDILSYLIGLSRSAAARNMSMPITSSNLPCFRPRAAAASSKPGSSRTPENGPRHASSNMPLRALQRAVSQVCMPESKWSAKSNRSRSPSRLTSTNGLFRFQGSLYSSVATTAVGSRPHTAARSQAGGLSSIRIREKSSIAKVYTTGTPSCQVFSRNSSRKRRVTGPIDGALASPPIDRPSTRPTQAISPMVPVVKHSAAL